MKIILNCYSKLTDSLDLQQHYYSFRVVFLGIVHENASLSAVKDMPALYCAFSKINPQNRDYLPKNSAQGDEVRSLPEATYATVSMTLSSRCMAEQMCTIFYSAAFSLLLTRGDP